MHQIGTGVLGPVFRTYDPESDRLVAVKAFDLDLTPEQADIFIEALKRIVEVGLMHPAIVAPLDAGLEEGVPFLATEYVAAESLDVAIHHDATVSADKIVTFVGPLAAAVDAAHARGVMHGGLHARDVFVESDITRVNGFGVVSALEHVGLKVPVRRPFTAPEIIAGRSWGPEADRFSIATLTYELLTGKRLAGSGDEVLARLLTIESASVADASGLQQAFRNALADDPAIRPASAAGFVMALGDAVGLSSEQITSAISGGTQESRPGLAHVESSDLEDESKLVRDEPLVGGAMGKEEPAANVNLHTEFRDSLDETFELTGSNEETNLQGQKKTGDSAPSLGVKSDAKISNSRVIDADELDSTVTEDKREGGVDQETETQVAENPIEHDAMLPLELEAEVEAKIVEEKPEHLPHQAVSSDDLTGNVSPASVDTSNSELEKFESESSYASISIDTNNESVSSDTENLNEGSNDLNEVVEEEQGENLAVSTSARPTSSLRDRPDVASDRITERASPSVESFSLKSSAPSLGRIASTLLAIAVGIALAYLASVGLGTPTDDEISVPVAETTELSSSSTGGDVEPLSDTQADEAIPPGIQSSNDTEDIAPVSTEIASVPDPGVSSVAGSPGLPSSSVAAVESSPITESTSSVTTVAQESSPSFGWLLVRTEPPGAGVSIDGEVRGVTPLSLSEIPSGVYRLEINMSGYRSELRTFEIASDKTVAALSIALDPLVPGEAGFVSTQSCAAGLIDCGSIFVDSRPTGASVLFDGESVGETPLIVEDVIVGSHEIRIVGEGYRPWLSTIQVETGQRSRVAASLEPTGRR